MDDFTGKVAVITGGGNGIGLGLARELGSAGCRLALADIDAEALKQAEESLTAAGFQVLTSVTDVRRLEEVQELADKVLTEYGTVDIVVNNAGVIAWNPVDALTIGDWRWVMDVNFYGVLHGVHVFLPIFERQGTAAHFVNVSSTGGVLQDIPFMATYSASKAAVIGLSLTLASELRMHRQPIGVTIVCPSGTRGTRAHLAERNRPSALGPLARTEEAQGLLDIVGDVVTRDGQPLATLARRVLDAVRRDELWVFPHPEAAAMVQPRLDGLTEVLRVAGTQPVADVAD